MRAAAGIVATAALAGVVSRGGMAWPLAFVMLVPWLRVLDDTPGLRATLLRAWALTLAFTAAAFGWFGFAIGRYTGVGEATGLALLLVLAPLFQPQIVLHALVRRVVGRSFGPALAALAASAAWVATEAVVPKLLGDTLGHALYPAEPLRLAAAWGGTAGLTLALLLTSEALAALWRQRHAGVRTRARVAALAVAPPLVLTLGGWAALQPPAAGDGPAPNGMLRMALVQTAIVDYERLRREKGADQVVREVLDTHYAMTYDAVERQRAQAVLWSETVYPTTFAQPKSDEGAAYDREIMSIVNAAGVPFVFGTYDRDAAGEYNAAAFVAPGGQLVGLYRKTRLFPLTEYVPRWLDSDVLRRWLPWAGGWRPGDGARVLPLRLADGREVPVLPLICLDAVDAGLAVHGARLGARLILSMSNDSWFTEHPLGAEWHRVVAAFRSVETRLPQFRVTSNGHSAVIDAYGRVLAGSRMGERTLVVGELPVAAAPTTLRVAWGDWVSGVCGAGLLALGLWAAARRWAPPATAAHDDAADAPLPSVVHVVPPAARVVAGALQLAGWAGLLALALAAASGLPLWPSNTLAQLRLFGAGVVAPLLAAAFVRRAYRQRLTFDASGLRLSSRGGELAVAATDVDRVQAWRLPLPAAGADVHLGTPGTPPLPLAGIDAERLHAALAACGSRATLQAAAATLAWARARRAGRRHGLDHPALMFGALPLLLSLPAYRLHQHIAYGGTFGEWQSFGALAFVQGLALWWAAWAMGIVLWWATLRAAVEAATWLAARLTPDRAPAWRRFLTVAARWLLYAGPPAALAWRALSG